MPERKVTLTEETLAEIEERYPLAINDPEKIRMAIQEGWNTSREYRAIREELGELREQMSDLQAAVDALQAAVDGSDTDD